MTGFGAADTDVVITFEDILAGKCGELEASLAQQQAARPLQDSEQSADNAGRIQVDDSGYDMRVGNRAGKRKRVIQTYDDSELRRSLRDKPTKITEPVLAKPGRKRRTDQAGPDVKRRKPGRPPGRGPGRPPMLHSPDIYSKGPLPSGWVVSLKESTKEIGRKFKQYQAPDGQTFCSYAKAQEHWQALGETPLRQPSTDSSKSSRRVARLPEGWEAKATHKDIGNGQGQVDKLFISPEGQQFESWADMQDHCKAKGVVLEAASDDDGSDQKPEPDFDLTDMLSWLHAAAAESPEWPAPGGGPLMQIAIARARAVLSIDDLGSVYPVAKRSAKF
ncbi:hypothetical protein ABBQ38_013290 [Trebouxia sp. C0009 RCD-2024]